MTNSRKAPSSTTVSSSKTPELQLRIQNRAYELYEAEGRQDGRDLDHWLQAEAEILGKQADSVAA